MASFRSVNNTFDPTKFHRASNILRLQNGNSSCTQTHIRSDFSHPLVLFNQDFIAGLGKNIDDRLNNNFAQLLMEYSNSVYSDKQTSCRQSFFFLRTVSLSMFASTPTNWSAQFVWLYTLFSCAKNFNPQRNTHKT